MDGNAHPPPHRIPSLDGLRAVSIMLVMYAHWGLTKRVPLLDRLPSAQYKYFGPLGVTMFFVISGFIITTLLMSEQRRNATIDLKDFYLRRTLRIFPAYYLYLAVIAVSAAFGIVAVTHRDLIMSALYLRDYFPHTTDWTNHTWSLAVEEQFYLIWPLLLCWLDRKHLIRVCLVVIALSPLVRILTYVLTPGLRDAIPIMFHTRADALMFGCLAALTRFDAGAVRFHAIFARRGGPIWALVAVGVLSPLLYARLHGGYLFAVGDTLSGACVAVLLIWAIDHRSSPVGRFLNWQPIVTLGTLSYSLYIWHVVFIAPIAGVIIAFPLNVILTFVVAWCSYRGIEVPVIALRRRFRPPHPPTQAKGQIILVSVEAET
jgi:peptidoglycan/LPS O-acetylase OafA/YrhL